MFDHYGLWKYRWTEKPDGTERGASSAVTRWDVRPPQELPGVSPAVIRFLLPLTLFGKITDLGYTLPALADKVQAVDMGEALGSHCIGSDQMGHEVGFSFGTLQPDRMWVRPSSDWAGYPAQSDDGGRPGCVV